MTDQERPEKFNRRIGENLQALRKARGMNQTELARQVAARGHTAWRQQTVVKVEQGERHLRLQEADDCAHVLDVDLDALVDERGSVDKLAELVGWSQAIRAAWDGLHNATFSMLEAQNWVRTILGPLEADKEPPIIVNEAATLLQLDPVEVVSAAAVEHGKRADVDEASALGSVSLIRFES